MSEPRPLPTTELDRGPQIDWGTLLEAHRGWLRRVVAARLGEPQAVDEVMQDVAVAAVSQHAPLQNPARVAAWLYRLAVRHVLIYRRKSGRRRSVFERYAARQTVGGTDGAPSPLAYLVRDEREQFVQAALKQLAPRDAELLILKYGEGVSARELAERLGASVNTIETRLHRARHRLRAVLAELASDFEALDHE
jgi:RNA polymerase sigma-70 factor (ECF subfamily)